MEKLTLILLQTIPEGFPLEVQMPGYFLKLLDSPGAITAVRALSAAAVILFVVQWIRREKQASREEK